MIADPAQLRVRRIRALTVMFCVAAAVLIDRAISKAQVLGKLPGAPAGQAAGRAGHAGSDLQRRSRVRRRYLLHRGHRPDRVGVIVSIIRTARRLRSLAWTIALGLLLGGAMGNLGDRLFRAPGLLRGRVVDWINLPHFPWTFNLADASITCAAVLIAVWRCAVSGSTEPPRRTPPTDRGCLPGARHRRGRAAGGSRRVPLVSQDRVRAATTPWRAPTPRR